MEEILKTLTPVWQFNLLGNTVGQFVGSLIAFIVVMVTSRIINHFVLSNLQRWAENTATSLDDLVVRNVMKPLYYVFLLMGIYFAKSMLNIPDLIDLWLTRFLLAIGIVVGFVCLFQLLERVMKVVADRYIEGLEEKAAEGIEEQKKTAYRIVKQVRELVLTIFIIVGLLTLLANLGVNLKAIWASLGIGGVAVVVAVKDPMTNIVGRIYILATGIFDEGHFIVFKQWAGTVKKIGFFRTNLEMFSDMTTVSVPNAQFITESVKNYYGRKKFMFKWDLDLPYEITSDRVERLIKALKEMILGLPQTNPDMCWIYLERLDKYAKVVRVWFQVNLPDWATSLTFGSQTLKQVQDVFTAEGVPFAFPTSTVHLPEMATRGPDPRVLLPGMDGGEPAA